MRRTSVTLVLGLMSLIVIAGVAIAQTKTGGKVPEVLNFTMNSLGGQPVNLSKYQGRAVLIVNTASECGYTYQYEGLQALHKKYASQGLSVLGFPSNDFGQQEPGSNAEIQQFCKANYGVEFDMFSKIDVLGDSKAPLYRFLTSKSTNPQWAGDVSWNFEKFLIDREGRIVGRFLSAVEPMSAEVTGAVESALAKK
jgi:glutathione peroxidase